MRLTEVLVHTRLLWSGSVSTLHYSLIWWDPAFFCNNYGQIGIFYSNGFHIIKIKLPDLSYALHRSLKSTAQANPFLIYIDYGPSSNSSGRLRSGASLLGTCVTGSQNPQKEGTPMGKKSRVRLKATSSMIMTTAITYNDHVYVLKCTCSSTMERRRNLCT